MTTPVQNCDRPARNFSGRIPVLLARTMSCSISREVLKATRQARIGSPLSATATSLCHDLRMTARRTPHDSRLVAEVRYDSRASELKHLQNHSLILAAHVHRHAHARNTEQLACPADLVDDLFRAAPERGGFKQRSVASHRR